MDGRTNLTIGPRELYGELVQAVVHGEADRYADLFAPDGVLEMPFRRPGIPPAHRGREAIRAAAQTAWPALPLRFEAVRDVRVHDTVDPSLVIAEHDLVGVGTGDGRPFSFPFLVLLWVRDGRITVFREYLNVVAVALATDRVAALVSSLDDPGAVAEMAPPVAPSGPVAPVGPSPEVEPGAGAGAAGPREVFARYQRAVLDQSPDGIADLFAPDGVFEYGFTVPGMPRRTEGQEEVRRGLRQMLGRFRFEEYRNVRIHQAADPEVVVVEHDIAGTIVATGRPHVMSYVYVLRVRDGRIVHLRDYANLLAAAEVSGGLAAFLDRFTTPSDR
ncbi:MAG TPA: nuclear transport factor 2 family protein [Iamia sp.]|nr:nuclear transport factor 2 family protein [Iamia sp.]